MKDTDLATAPRPAPDSVPTAETLLEKLKNPSDEESWKRFVDTYSRLLLRYARRAGLDEDAARDVVQETTVEVVRRMPDFKYMPGKCAFKTWLYVIVQHRVADHFRKKKYHADGKPITRETSLDEEDVNNMPLPVDALEEVWEDEWRKHALDTALNRVRIEMKPQLYQMFHLNVIRNVPAAEVAERFQTKVMAVYWARLRVGRRLAAIMREIEKAGG